jgi:transposase-like protein
MLSSHDECLDVLEQIRWKGIPKCPYCESTNATAYKSEKRYHCNSCFTSYSVTVGTIFHKTRVDLRKWFLAIALVMDGQQTIGVRELARKAEIDKNTAMNMIKRIEQCAGEERAMLHQIVQEYNRLI